MGNKKGEISSILQNPSIKVRTDLSTIFAIIALFLLNIIANNWVELKALCLDDLANWTLYNKSETLEYIFNTGANKFRPVYNLVIYGLFKLFENNIWLFDITNLLISFFVSVILFFISFRISKNTIVGFCVGVAFLMSRFAYYQISQVFGIMEAMALIFAIVILFCLYVYLNDSNNSKSRKFYMIACIMYLFISYTHERYIVLYPMFIITYFLKEKLQTINKQRLILLLAPTIIFIATILLRSILFGGRALDGTGGTEILDTLNIKQVFVFLFSQLLYIFGINAGPTYLNGIQFTLVPVPIYILNAIYIICALIVLILFIKQICIDSCNRTKYIQNSILFIVFIGLCIISSSVTIRVELRWIYVSFVGMLLFFSYMFYAIIQSKKIVTKNYRICIALFLTSIIAFVPMELFYRSNWRNLYYWGTQTLFNSLYDKTLGTYGSDFWDKKTTIISNDEDIISKEMIDLFYLQFEEKNVPRAPNISISKVLGDLSQNALLNGNIILAIDKKNNQFIEITDLLRESPSNNLMASTLKEAVLPEGWSGWEGGNKDYIWTGQTSEIKLLSKENGKMILIASILEFNLPNTLTIYINAKVVAKVDLKNSNVEVTVDVPKNEVVDIKLELDHATSPYNVGKGEDRRTLGLCISNIIMQ